MTKLKLSVGDVFTVPLDGSRVGVGQIVAKYGNHQYYFGIYDRAYDSVESINIDAAVQARLALLALSLDAKLFHNDWKIVGKALVRPDIPLPAYKEGGADNRYKIVDHSGHLERDATPEEASQLDYRTTVAPVRIETAFRAMHGQAEWSERFESLVPDYGRTTAVLFA